MLEDVNKLLNSEEEASNFKDALGAYFRYLVGQGKLSQADSLRVGFGLSEEELGGLLRSHISDKSHIEATEARDNTSEYHSKPEQKNEGTDATGELEGVVVRELKGATVRVRRNDYQESFWVPEVIVRRFDLAQGDRVSFEPYNGKAMILEVTHRNKFREESRPVFEQGIVEADDTGRLVVTRNYQGETLSNYAKSVGDRLDKFVVPDWMTYDDNPRRTKEGDIIDVVWEYDQPETAMIRWNYDKDNAEEPTERTRQHNKKAESEKTSPQHIVTDVTQQIDFDLDGQTVGVVVGNAMRAEEIREMGLSHNGKAEVVDGFKIGNKITSYYQAILKRVSYIVMVQNQNKHNTSKIVFDYAKANHIPIAIADGLGLQQVERAIYRAMNGLPAYESGLQIQYPVKGIN